MTNSGKMGYYAWFDLYLICRGCVDPKIIKTPTEKIESVYDLIYILPAWYKGEKTGFAKMTKEA